MLRNDFMKWHLSFIVPYILTYSAGLLRGKSLIAYKLHPLFGISTLVLPLLAYILLPNKKLIRQMIRNNFNFKGNLVMKAAKISTQIIFTYFIFSAFTGFILNNGLYGTPAIYQVLSTIHGIAKFLVPMALTNAIFVDAERDGHKWLKEWQEEQSRYKLVVNRLKTKNLTLWDPTKEA